MISPLQREGPRQRLTWGANGPAPYESAWLLFLKLCALNLSGLTYISNVIKKECISPSNIQTNYYKGYWIDFNKFSQALGVPENQLRTSFLDLLGVYSVEDPGVVNIRHCPDCIAIGYHSVIFQIDLISKCPWHHKNLIACDACTRVFNRVGVPWKRKVKDDPKSGRLIEMACGHFTFGSGEGPILPRLDVSLWPIVIQKVEDILEWWNLGAAQPTEGRILSLASSWRHLARSNEENNQVKSARLVLGLFEKKVGPSPFDPIVLPLRSRLLVWNSQPIDLHQHTDPISHDNYLFKHFKSLRRQLRRRHLRQHKRCFNYLSHLDEQESHSLSSETMCSACLAWITWEMSLRGITTVAQFRSSVSTSLRSCIPTSPIYSDEIMICQRSMMNFWIAHFYDVWSHLELCGRGKQFRVVMEDTGFKKDFIRTLYRNSCSEVYVGDGTMDKHWMVYTEPEYLAERNDLHCKKRRKDKDMLSIRGLNTVAFWAYGKLPDAIFRGWQSEPYVRENLWIKV